MMVSICQRSAAAAFTVWLPLRDYGCYGPHGGVDSSSTDAEEWALLGQAVDAALEMVETALRERNVARHELEEAKAAAADAHDAVEMGERAAAAAAAAEAAQAAAAEESAAEESEASEDEVTLE